MLTRIVSIEPQEGGLLIVQIGNQSIAAMNCLGYGADPVPGVGEEIDIEFSCLTGEDETWDQVFSGNPAHERQLTPTGTWSYRAFGQLVSVGPEAMVDCGICQLDAPIRTEDARCVGAYVAFNVSRLDAWRKE